VVWQRGQMKFVKRILKLFLPKSFLDARRLRRWLAFAASSGVEVVVRDVFLDLQKPGKILRIRRAHDFYLTHIVENFDFYFGSVVPVPEGDCLLVDMSGPRFHRLKGFSDLPFLFPSHTEPYEATEEYLKFACLSAGQVVLDIGAYSGVTSISFAKAVGERGHVYAFEADAVNYGCAAENIALAKRWMGVENITLVHKAVWSHCDGILFSNELAMGSSAVEITGGGRGLESRVASTTLEDFCRERNVQQVDLIKIDIEGAEIEVLEHAARWLTGRKARLIVEPHHVNGTLSTDRCVAVLERAGFSVRLTEQVGVFPPLILAEAQ
jgi:FkbM family methyltransferase